MQFRQFYVTLSTEFEHATLMRIFNRYINDLSIEEYKRKEARTLKDKLLFNSICVERDIETPFDNQLQHCGNE